MPSLGIAIVIKILNPEMTLREMVITVFIFFNVICLLKYRSDIVLGGVFQGAGFGTGISLIGGGGGAEETTTTPPPCEASECEAPPLTLASKISNKISGLLKPKPKPKAEINAPENKKIQESESISVKTSSMSLCEALRKANWNPTWTIHDIKKIKQQEEQEQEQEQLTSINNELQQLTGMSNIRNIDIANCYPEYLPDYECVKNTTSTSTSDGHCNLDEVNNQLSDSIKNHYKKIRPTLTPDRWSLLFDYTLQRAELEFKNLINVFQSRNRTEWLQHLTRVKKEAPEGLLISGTEYSIPWDIFENFKMCFGTD